MANVAYNEEMLWSVKLFSDTITFKNIYLTWFKFYESFAFNLPA